MLIRKQVEVEKGFKKIGKSQKKAAKDGEKATKRTKRALTEQQRANQRLLSSVKSLAGGYLGVNALVIAAVRESRPSRPSTRVHGRLPQSRLPCSRP